MQAQRGPPWTKLRLLPRFPLFLRCVRGHCDPCGDPGPGTRTCSETPPRAAALRVDAPPSGWLGRGGEGAGPTRVALGLVGDMRARRVRKAPPTLPKPVLASAGGSRPEVPSVMERETEAR